MASDDRALVSFERRRYSVPVEHAGQRLWLRAFAEQIEIWTQTLASPATSDSLGQASRSLTSGTTCRW